MSALKNFLITFLIAALVFGIIGFFTAQYVSGVMTGILDGEGDKLGEIKSDNNNDNNPVEDENNDYTGPMPDGESFTYLFVGTDYRPGVFTDYYGSVEELQKLISTVDKDSDIGVLSTGIRYIRSTWIILLRADKENHEFYFCYFSPETLVSTQAGDRTLGDVYGMYGIDGLCEYISYMTGLSVDRYALVDADNLSAFMEVFGSVDFDLGAEIFEAGREYVSSPVRMDFVAKDDGEDKNKDKEESKSDEEKNDDEDKTESKNESGDLEYKEVENESALKVGSYGLSDNTIYIINVFREYSAADIDVKSSYTIQIIRRYLESCAEMSEADLLKKFEDASHGNKHTSSDPYEIKETIGTNFTVDDVKNLHSMAQAFDYFNIRTGVYPGNYSIPDGAAYGRYEPNVEEGLKQFGKYRGE